VRRRRIQQRPRLGIMDLGLEVIHIPPRRLGDLVVGGLTSPLQATSPLTEIITGISPTSKIMVIEWNGMSSPF